MTFLDLLLITLSAAALHRIWNYEEVCATARSVAKRFLPEKPTLCPVCNAFWFGLMAVVLWMFAHPFVLLGLSAYAATRTMVLVWPFVDDWAKKNPTKKLPETKPTGKLITPAPQQVPTKPFDRIVVLLTALNDFTDSYSVSIDVLHQARAIAMQNPTWQVQVWMTEGAKQTGWNFMPENTFVRTIVPRMAWQKDMPVDDASVNKLLSFMKVELGKLPKDTVVIEHDLMFVSWYAPFAEAMHRLKSDLLWFHVPHSMPGSREGKHKALVTLPAGKHFLAPVALVEKQRFVDYYGTTDDRVIPIPNPFDPRMWGSVSHDVFDIATKTQLTTKEYVQILPACSTRLDAKGFVNVARVFGLLSKHHKVHLLVCNPNAASNNIIEAARSRAESVGLARADLSFTSELLPQRARSGLSGADVKTLMQDYGNIFVFPSISESDSRVCMEARLCRQFIVANEDVLALHAHADMLVSFSKTNAEAACEYAANRIMERGLRIRRHSGRDLEGIGDLWRQVINDARLP
jgi:hypothetical protein